MQQCSYGGAKTHVFRLVQTKQQQQLSHQQTDANVGTHYARATASDLFDAEMILNNSCNKLIDKQQKNTDNFNFYNILLIVLIICFIFAIMLRGKLNFCHNTVMLNIWISRTIH